MLVFKKAYTRTKIVSSRWVATCNCRAQLSKSLLAINNGDDRHATSVNCDLVLFLH